MLYTKNDFGDNYKWGISTAAYQVEGGYNVHDKGPSIWDTLTKKKKKIFNFFNCFNLEKEEGRSINSFCCKERD